ncbi:MAG TPA: KilA-N domain-containing protein [Arsenophonus nasoniae]|uniref:KilA-N domain-containing protein n=1 Tax=Arsenophonus nasoniae TaxID=638 RepID=UPI0038792725
MKYPKVNIYGIPVRVDEEGRFSLNDLHAAAVIKGEATESQKPSKFMRSSQIKNFVQVLSAGQNCPAVVVNNGGCSHGVWGLELVAIRYAAWIKPEFEIQVYNTFRHMVMNGFDAMYRLNQLDLTINSESKEISQCASKMGRWGAGGRKRLLMTAREKMIEEVQPFLPGVE